MPMFLFGQSYSALWKQVSEAEEKDLPKTQYEVLQKIVKKAEKEQQYGQLLKAELYAAQTMVHFHETGSRYFCTGSPSMLYE